MRKRTIMNRKWAADPSALLRTLGKLQPFTAAELVALETPPRVSWESFKRGRATESDFHTLASAINVSMVRAEDIDPIALDMCNRALEALMRVKSRFDRIGTWGLDWMSMAHVPPALDFYDQLLELSTPLQMQLAMSETLKRMAQGNFLGATNENA